MFEHEHGLRGVAFAEELMSGLDLNVRRILDQHVQPRGIHCAEQRHLGQ
jgi:hypothetical protein